MVKQETLQMHYEYDCTGYPCFYVHGISGDDKRDTALLNEYVKLFRKAPDMLDMLRQLEVMFRHFRGCNLRESLPGIYEALQRTITDATEVAP